VYFDALTTAAVVDELGHTLLGGRVQDVVQVDDLTIGLEVYAQHRRQYLIASAHSQHARLHLTPTKLRRGVDTPMPILLLLRKYVRGGQIVAVRQPPFERIVHLDMAGAEGTCTLVVETMGRHSNVILCAEDGVVMDSIKRVGPRLSRVRPVLPGSRYEPPPPQKKLDPTDVTERQLRQMLLEARPAQPVWRVLVNGIRGVSPLLAKEIAYRAMGSTEPQAEEVTRITPLLGAYDRLMEHVWEHAWEPCVALEEGQPVAFAPYLLTQYRDWEQLETVSQAIDRYESAVASADAYGPARAQVRTLLDEAHKRAESRRGSLERQLIPQAELDKLRLSGEMILAYAHAVRAGQRQLEAQVDMDGPPMAIALDPDKTAVENAQDYFRRYEKAKAATADIPRLLKSVRLELAYLDQLSTDLALASNRPEIDEVRTALVERGYAARKRGAQAQRGQPLRFTSAGGMSILVGRSARQNHEVTFRRAAPDDLWLHAVGASGAHVVIKSGGAQVPEETLRQAAQLAARYSSARDEAGVDVAYTQRRYVRQIKGAGPGMVTYRHEQTIRVTPKQQ
jgi:predicted ribosome quality control (RQC) complex YloA/Tae2 family protein